MRRRLLVALAVGLLLILAGCSKVTVEACPICEEEARNVYVDSDTSVVNESVATITVTESGTVHWRVENDLDLSADQELLPRDRIERRARERIEEPQVGTDGPYLDRIENVSVTSPSREQAVITFTTGATATDGPDGVVIYDGLSTRYDGSSVNARTITVGGPGESARLFDEGDQGEIDDGTVRFDRAEQSIDPGTTIVFTPDDGLTSRAAMRLALFDRYDDMLEFVAKALAVLALGALVGVVLLAPSTKTPLRNVAALEFRHGHPLTTGAIAAVGLIGAGILASQLPVGWPGVIAIAVVATGGTLAVAARLGPWSRREGAALCLFVPLVPAAVAAILVWGPTDPGARLVPSAGWLGTALATLAIGAMTAAGAAGLHSRWHLLGATLPPAVFVYGYMLFWSWPVQAPTAGLGYLAEITITFAFFTVVGIVAYDAGRGFREEVTASAERGTSPADDGS